VNDSKMNSLKPVKASVVFNFLFSFSPKPPTGRDGISCKVLGLGGFPWGFRSVTSRENIPSRDFQWPPGELPCGN
jgi:hypothetical protein